MSDGGGRVGIGVAPDGTEHRFRLFLPSTGVPRATIDSEGYWTPVPELAHWRKVSGEWAVVTTDYGLEVTAELQSRQDRKKGVPVSRLPLEPPTPDDVPYDVLVCAVRTLTGRVDKLEEMWR